MTKNKEEMVKLLRMALKVSDKTKADVNVHYIPSRQRATVNIYEDGYDPRKKATVTKMINTDIKQDIESMIGKLTKYMEDAKYDIK
jgi:hypothetical protein